MENTKHFYAVLFEIRLSISWTNCACLQKLFVVMALNLNKCKSYFEKLGPRKGHGKSWNFYTLENVRTGGERQCEGKVWCATTRYAMTPVSGRT